MNLKTHTAYPEAMPESDGSFTGRIYAGDGRFPGHVADISHLGHVPGIIVCLSATGQTGRASGSGRI